MTFQSFDPISCHFSWLAVSVFLRVRTIRKWVIIAFFFFFTRSFRFFRFKSCLLSSISSLLFEVWVIRVICKWVIITWSFLLGIVFPVSLHKIDIIRFFYNLYRNENISNRICNSSNLCTFLINKNSYLMCVI